MNNERRYPERERNGLEHERYGLEHERNESDESHGPVGGDGGS